MSVKKLLKKLVCFSLAAALSCTAMLGVISCKAKTDFTVGICQLTKHSALDKATQGFQDALNEELAAAGKTVTIEFNQANNDPSSCSTIVNTYVSRSVDLILANATPALQAAVNATETIPILGTSVTDYGVALGIDNFNGLVGGNVSGTSDLAPLERQADMLVEYLPNAKTVGLLYCSSEVNSEYQVRVIKARLESNGVTCKTYKFADSNELNSVCTLAVNECDALYVPTDNTVADNAVMIDGLCRKDNKKVPVFAGEESTCKACGFATLTISYYEIGRKTGKMAADILLGRADISQMKIAYDDNPIVKFNEQICNDLGIKMPTEREVV